MVEKLKIKVLPCVIGFVDGVGAERIVGFEGLGEGGADADREFSTVVLEWRFLRRGVVVKSRVSRDKNGKDNGDASDDDGSGGNRTGSEDEEEKSRNPRKGIRSGTKLTRALKKNGDEDDDWD